jgi:hypothetical protein
VSWKREERLTGVYDKLIPLPATSGDGGRFSKGTLCCRASQNQAQRRGGRQGRGCPLKRVKDGVQKDVLRAVDVMQHTVSDVIHNHCGQPAML